MKCPCRPEHEFSSCCEPRLKGKNPAETAESLMRSRYSAYVFADINYLLNSHHSSTRPTKERKQILKWTKSVRWLKLEIISIEKGSTADHEGYVEFKAFYEEQGRVQCIHEKSYFVKEANKWYYQSGQHF